MDAQNVIRRPKWVGVKLRWFPTWLKMSYVLALEDRWILHLQRNITLNSYQIDNCWKGSRVSMYGFWAHCPLQQRPKIRRGCLLPDIKRRSLSSLLDRIPSEKEPCYSCWAAELYYCGGYYRKLWLVSAFNDFSGDSGLTFTKKLAIRAVWDPLELLCFFSWCKVILSQHGISVLMIDNLHKILFSAINLPPFCCW